MKKQQKGAATLFVTVIILALLTVIAVVSAKIGMFELKTSANTNRAKESLLVAQGALDYGALQYLHDASWASGSLEIPYSGPGASASVAVTVGSNSVLIEAEGESLDKTGLARVQEKYARVPILDVGELPPLMANGNFPANGSFSIVPNPNGGGPGVPVSGWTQAAAKQGQASWDTCNLDEWLYEGNANNATYVEYSDGFVTCDKCECSAAEHKLCTSSEVAETDECPDVVTADPIIDTFQQLFGIDPNLDKNGNGYDDWYDFMRSFAAVELSSCSSLGPNYGDRFYEDGKPHTLPLIWVKGHCDLKGQIGSYDAPIIVFVEGQGDPNKGITINAGAEFYGILFGFVDKYPNEPLPNDTDMNISATGGATIYGVFMMNKDFDKATGTLNLVYANSLLKKLVNVDDTFYELARYPGSWTDTQ